MRIPLAVLLCSSFLYSQTSVPSLTVASQAVGAFSQVAIQEITLSGTAKAYAGSSQPSGTFTATIKSTGESILKLNLSELSRTETTGPTSDPPQCQWSDADGVQHEVAQHNCLLPLHWLAPVLGLQTQASQLTASVATGMDKAVAVQTLSLTRPAIDAKQHSQVQSNLSRVKLYLDSSNGLPTSLSFNVHPDNNELMDIPIVVRYSDYREVHGARLPFHIQKFLNNALVLDLAIETVEVQ